MAEEFATKALELKPKSYEAYYTYVWRFLFIAKAYPDCK